MKRFVCILLVALLLLSCIAFATEQPPSQEELQASSQEEPQAPSTEEPQAPSTEEPQEASIAEEQEASSAKEPQAPSPEEPQAPSPEEPQATSQGELIVAELVKTNEYLHIMVYFIFPFLCAVFILWQLAKWFYRVFVNSA